MSEGQIGGHAGGIVFLDDGKMAKVSEKVEIAFYEETEAIRNDSNPTNPDLQAFTGFVPRFYGLHDDQSTTSPEAPMIRMQNMTHEIAKACVADFKVFPC